jgi:hypothetical protein
MNCCTGAQLQFSNLVLLLGRTLTKFCFVGLVATSGTGSAIALPPPEDTPEEVLRTEIIVEARSPIDGEPLTAAEYAELQEQLQNPDRAPQVSPQVRQIIFLLQIRRTIRTVFPFLLN